uniref:Dolichyldiphosphatase n=1 Tax=Alexandrium catenella TaxID=2925 RepID=A0A7S1QSI5_ALECA|mmetsp:Transcript_37898/g.102614  ORF Transcript_37898/g.102614 Transcript_37898/m.102614 type:complete len:362 (+) Transcript_37898:23-1108(+)
MDWLGCIILVHSFAAVMSRSHHHCYGVWTKEWQEQEGGLPSDLPLDLDEPRYAGLKERVSRNECPFGTSLVGQVTWPSPPQDLWDVVEQRSPMQVAAVIVSYIPYAVALWAIVVFCVARGTRQLFVLLWLALFVIVNEFVIKELFHVPRPGANLEWSVNGKLVGSCLGTCGMPSSHSGLSCGLWLLIFLDASQRVGVPHIGGWRRRAQERRELASGGKGKRQGALVKSEAQECIVFTVRCWVLPWAQANCYSHDEYSAYVFFWTVLLGPVPFSRLILYDHSVKQVLAGMTEGTVLAVVWWRLVRNVQKRYRFPNGMTFLGGWIIHNFEATAPDHAEETSDSSDEERTSSGSPPLSSEAPSD